MAGEDKTISQLAQIAEIAPGDAVPVWQGVTKQAIFGTHIPYLIGGVIPEEFLPSTASGTALAAAILSGLDESERLSWVASMGGVRWSDLDDPSYATAADLNAGTDIEKLVTPDALAGSNLGRAAIAIEVFGPTVEHATGDGKKYWTVPSILNGMNLIRVSASIVTAGTTGTLTVQVHNLTDAADMLSTRITIDSAETHTKTAATPAVINAATDDVATDDVLRFDIDTVHTTEGFGLVVNLEFGLP